MIIFCISIYVTAENILCYHSIDTSYDVHGNPQLYLGYEWLNSHFVEMGEEKEVK